MANRLSKNNKKLINSIDNRKVAIYSLFSKEEWDYEDDQNFVIDLRFLDKGKIFNNGIEFCKMLELIKANQIKQIIVPKIYHISNNVNDMLSLFNLLKQYNCNLIVFDEYYNLFTANYMDTFAITMIINCIEFLVNEELI